MGGTLVLLGVIVAAAVADFLIAFTKGSKPRRNDIRSSGDDTD
jgi:hypothetical protein